MKRVKNALPWIALTLIFCAIFGELAGVSAPVTILMAVVGIVLHAPYYWRSIQ